MTFFARFALLAVGNVIYRRWGWKGILLTLATVFTTAYLIEWII